MSEPAADHAALSSAYPLPLYAQLAELLRRRIADGVWHEGDRLPSQAGLAESFDAIGVLGLGMNRILQSVERRLTAWQERA